MTDNKLVAGRCFKCGVFFQYNPDYRPIYGNTRGRANLVCKVCLHMINQKRAKLGLSPHIVSEYAYGNPEGSINS